MNAMEHEDEYVIDEAAEPSEPRRTWMRRNYPR